MGSHFTHKYHLISQLYLAIISTNTSSASQIIFIFVKCEIYLGGEGHHKTYSMALGRMPWAQNKIFTYNNFQTTSDIKCGFTAKS